VRSIARGSTANFIHRTPAFALKSTSTLAQIIVRAQIAAPSNQSDDEID
jgi:hypothetical protein